MADNDFPKLDGGWCDGLGCGRGHVCFCAEYLAMKEEFQKVFNKAWNKDDTDCINWEKAWRFGTSRYNEAWEEMVIRKIGSCEVVLKE